VTGPDPATAAIRVAVRRALGECDPGDVVLVALSGGADSLALAAAVAFEAPAAAVRAGAVVVDHALQEGSGDVARRAAEMARSLGLDPVEVVPVRVPGGPDGPEAAAREVRYTAFAVSVERLGARLVLLGHTRDDQAEQVLLGLARGAGTRSLSGMPQARGRLRRPLLGISREQTRESCARQGLGWWDDPMNDDPSYLRVRARRAVADLERDLGPGVAAALALSADLLRADADHLDGLAEQALADLGDPPWDVAEVAPLPAAVRTRVWRRALIAAGAPAGQVGRRHTDACDALVSRWHGQGPVSAPGGVEVSRVDGRLLIGRAPRVEWA
jgi:tRNA(Ile)-lysidine synthase